MIVKLIQSLISGKSNEAVEQGAIEEAKQKKQAKLIDVPFEALRAEAAKHRADLDGMVKYGWPCVKREKFKGSARKKVWDIVKRSLGNADSDMVEEITERIADVAEVDPYYQSIFEEKSE